MSSSCSEPVDSGGVVGDGDVDVDARLEILGWTEVSSSPASTLATAASTLAEEHEGEIESAG